MMTLIFAAAAAAAQPAVPAQPLDAHAKHQQAAGQHQHGQMAEMKDCCCKDMMAKMHESHQATHEGHSGR